MYLNDLNSSRHNVEKLNRILADTFKHDVDLSQMTTDSLNRMLNTTNAKMTAIKESDLKYWENPQYNKLGLIQHQLKTYLSEIAPTRKDGKKMKKESTVMEADLDQAEVLLAAQELVDEMQKMVENIAEMQVQKLMPIVDAMKEQVGFDVAEQYNTAADGALGTLLDAMKTAKTAVENATLAARGEPVNTPAPTDMGAEEPPMDADEDMEAPDEFGGDDSMAGEENPVGRELKGESALANMERGALAEKKFLESKDRLFKMVESGQMSQEHFINVINELDEGFLDNLKAVGKVAGGGLAKGLGYMLTRSGDKDRRAQDGGFSDRLGRGLTNIGNDAYDSGMDTLSKSVSGYATKRNDLKKLTNSAVKENPQSKNNDAFLQRRLDQRYGRGEFAPKPTSPAPLDGGIAPGTTKGGPSKLRQRQMQKQKQAPAPLDGGIAPGTTKGGPSKLRQRQMQKQLQQTPSGPTLGTPQAQNTVRPSPGGPGDLRPNKLTDPGSLLDPKRGPNRDATGKEIFPSIPKAGIPGADRAPSPGDLRPSKPKLGKRVPLPKTYMV